MISCDIGHIGWVCLCRPRAKLQVLTKPIMRMQGIVVASPILESFRVVYGVTRGVKSMHQHCSMRTIQYPNAAKMLK